MVITWYGEGCFKLQSGELTMLVDPFDNKIGLTPPRFKADILLKTLNSFKSIDEADKISEDSSAIKIAGPGEYNVYGIDIAGLPLLPESTDQFFKTIYLAEFEEMKICCLGHISEPPEPAIMEHLEEIDVIFVPAGGSPFLSQKSAVQLLKKIEPKLIVPSFFKTAGLKRPTADVKIFLEELGRSSVESQEKLTIKKKDLLTSKSMQAAVLKI